MVIKRLCSKRYLAFIIQSNFIKIKSKPYSIAGVNLMPWILTIFKSWGLISKELILGSKKMTVLS